MDSGSTQSRSRWLAVLFFVIPVLTYVPFGYDAAASIWMMAVIINLHHFIVDGFIWKSGKARGQSAPSGAAARHSREL